MRLDHLACRLPGPLLVGLCLALAGAQALAPAPASADVVECDEKAGKALQEGSETTDLEVTGPCEVKAGKTYTYRNVNIFRDRRKDPDRAYAGTLKFAEPRRGADTHFFAQSILIENHGSLIAGSPNQPIGPEGKITIHLWGPENAPGITCKTDDQCGVPDTIWNSNANASPDKCTPMEIQPEDEPPGGGIGRSRGPRLRLGTDRAPVQDCFYRYEKLNAEDTDQHAYFGHKVLALSYGGTLQLFGDKGAIYDGRERSTCKEQDPSCSGTSWVRLKGSIQPGDTVKELKVDGKVDWRDGDHIVVTTTDYLPSHSEELIIVGDPSSSGNVTTIKYRNADGVTPGVKWPHNGEVYDLGTLPSRLGIDRKSVETRAAVALLSRSIEIVSEGDHPVANSFQTGYYGGHTIVRQGFDTYQVQGVRFHQLGQGGRMMHYPVHFHMARRTPQPIANGNDPITFVKDSSIDDSMTRWITIHGTQGVTLARNVGYMSIGHGFYLEDGTETDNKFYSNIGIYARPAVANDANPRRVPGILTATAPADRKDASGFDDFPYYSDSNNPSVFWIMNGWNDFHSNMAAGAGTCGACYWFVPGAISGPSRNQKWFGYASEQRGKDRAAMTPLKQFVGNSCSSAMNAFTVNSTTAACNGVNQRDPAKYKPDSILTMLPSEGATKAYKDQGSGKPPLIDENYWPIVGGGGRIATRCKAADDQAKNPFVDVTSDCSKVPRCGDGPASVNCDVTAISRFTTSFNWAEKNLAAVWMRPFWSLVTDSAVTDVQNAGINFVTSGDFSKSSVITGFWALARKTVFIGTTQKDNPFASSAGAFNPIKSKTLKQPDGMPVTGLKCAVDPNSGANNVSYCLSKQDGVSIQLGAFSAGQRFFSVYDGPAYQDSNAYLDIHPTYLTTDGTVNGDVIGGCKPDDNNPNPCPFAGYMNGGSPGVLADKKNNKCYLPNAAIGWKQPNGFYYAPAFHSKNLFFADGDRTVDIRHFVIEPLFQGDTFDTDVAETKKLYCYRGTDQPKPGMFQGFTDIDRETVLNDDDGTLTGLVSKGAWTETISVNKEAFFDAPVEAPECASDLPLNPTGNAKCAPNTAKTSPYEYLTTAIFPECALTVPDSDAPLRTCAGNIWGSNCTTSDPTQINSCVGVRLYRQLLIKNEPVGIKQLKRMMGQNTFQRSALTANHGIYYIDTTVSADKQQMDGAKSFNTFVGGQKYDIFFLYSKPTTQQTYELYVGKDADADFGKTHVKFGYVDIATAKYRFAAAKPPGKMEEGALPDGWASVYDKSTGYLSLMIDMKSLAEDYDLKKETVPGKGTLGERLCQPKTMCGWNQGSGKCECTISDPSHPLYKSCHEKNAAGDDAICSWSIKDLDCPTRGCPALQITFPDGYKPDDAPDHHRPPGILYSDSMVRSDWDVALNPVGMDLSGKQCSYTKVPGCPAP